MNIVHLVVVETLSTLWNLEEPFTKISSFQSYFGDKKLSQNWDSTGGLVGGILIIMPLVAPNLQLTPSPAQSSWSVGARYGNSDSEGMIMIGDLLYHHLIPDDSR